MKLFLPLFALAIGLPASLANLLANQRVSNLRSLETSSGDCEICSSDNKDKPDSLIVQYVPNGVNSQYQDSSKASCRAGMYPWSTRLTVVNKSGVRQTFDVTADDIFQITGPFSAETTFEYDSGDCYIHTSCSVPLVNGDQIGAFKMLAGNNCLTPGIDNILPPVDGTPEGTCEICSKDNKDKPEFLTIEYVPTGVNSAYQDSDKATCRAGTYPATTNIVMTNKDGTTQTFPNVAAGDVFTIHGPFDAETTFSYDGGHCFIHTSCSAPLVTNDQIGPFKMLAGNECNGDPDSVPPAVDQTSCEICSSDNKDKPDSLALQYIPAGVNSQYQDSKKASCRAGTYPTTTRLTMENKNGIRQTFDVTAGDNITIAGPFSAETTFTYDGGDCYIHTSCSVPLVTNDQIGPFKVVAGNECGTVPPAVPPTTEGTCEICSKDNKDKPEFLVIQYVPTGVNSAYQDADKATCRAGTYPTPTNIVMTNKDGETQTFHNVEYGDVFTIRGPFNAETYFTYDGGHCSIHTSCSAPLVTNDQIGPFKILAGNECLTDPPTLPPSPPPTPTPGSPTSAPTSPPTPIPGMPTHEPTPPPTPTPGTPTAAPNTLPPFDLIDTPPPTLRPSSTSQEGPTSEPTLPPTPTPGTPTSAPNTLPPFDLIDTPPPTSPPTPIPGMPTSEPTLPPTPTPGTPTAEPLEGPCEICSKNEGTQPDELTIVYRSEGKDSEFQNEREASCGVGTYPESATLIFTNDNGVVRAIDVKDGEAFTIVGPFKDKTSFQFSGETTKCTITLSCSAPLVAGDQLGPFLITEGNDCKFETSQPTQAPSPSPSAAPSTSTSPSPAPTGGPSPSPSEPPSPAPSDAPSTPPPTIEPTSAPSASPSDPPSPAPSDPPSASPSQAPTRAPCVTVNKEEFVITENVEVTYNVDYVPEDPLTNNGWICIYPCAVTEYFNSYHWRCGKTPGNCVPADSTGEMLFSTGGDACSVNDQRWPVAPSYLPDGNLNTCHKIVIVRTTTTENIEICESDHFTVIDTEEECA